MKVNLGSGKNYRKDCLNIDINPLWKPDIVADISKGVPITGWCNEIIAHDVLEHIPDLVSAMTNCLEMLIEDGTMEISVPYYLSVGAWQDPTHIRAFNENSWIYYTEWFWYLGWKTYRFEIVKMDFILSPYGESLKQEHPEATQWWILTMPKAVDSMHVVLKKVGLTEEEKKIGEAYYGVHH